MGTALHRSLPETVAASCDQADDRKKNRNSKGQELYIKPDLLVSFTAMGRFSDFLAAMPMQVIFNGWPALMEQSHLRLSF